MILFFYVKNDNSTIQIVLNKEVDDIDIEKFLVTSLFVLQKSKKLESFMLRHNALWFKVYMGACML